MTLDFTGKVAIITGAGRGIGREHARQLAARGAAVVVNDYGSDRFGDGGGNATPADEVAREIVEGGGKAMAACVDITDEAATHAMVNEAAERFGRIDIVIHNASVFANPSPFGEAKSSDLQRIMRVNVDGGWHVAQAAWKYMVEKQYGRVVMTGSGAGFFGRRRDHAYSVAKSALIGFTKLLATEGAEHGIKSNIIGPIAWTDTSASQGIPSIMERFARPEQVSHLVTVLSHECCPVTGEMFHVGGGFASRIFMGETQGTAFAGDAMSPEAVLERFEQIMAEPGYTVPANSDRSGALVSKAIASVEPDFARILAEAKAARDRARQGSQ